MLTKPENYARMVALYTASNNVVWIHKSIRITPAMAAEVRDRLRSVDDIAASMDTAAPTPSERRSRRKRESGKAFDFTPYREAQE